MGQPREKLCALRQGQLCVAEFNGRKRVLMRVLLVKSKSGTFDADAEMYVQLSGRNHTEGHGIVYTGLDQDMLVTMLETTVSVTIFD